LTFFFPFVRMGNNKSLVNVPDRRLEQLADHFQLPPIHARIEYHDAGAISFGEVKNTTFLDLLRRADGLVHIIRGFDDPEIVHPAGSVDPFRDIQTMEEELITTDFIGIEKRLERIKSDLQKMKSIELEDEYQLLTKLKDFLEQMKPIREFPFNIKEEFIVRGFKFISQKPLIHIINSDEVSYQKYLKNITEPGKSATTQIYCSKIETELLELDAEERPLFQAEYGLEGYEYLKESFVHKSYLLMNQISFFTIGKEEVKAWTINGNATALKAAGKIHEDIQKGFIRAEVAQWQQFLDAGGFNQAREKGVLRLEGKEYIIKDGEVIHFRFNK